MSQSYSKGPQTREQCKLTQGCVAWAKDGRPIYGPIVQTGVLDFATPMTVARHDDIVVQHPPYAPARRTRAAIEEAVKQRARRSGPAGTARLPRMAACPNPPQRRRACCKA